MDRCPGNRDRVPAGTPTDERPLDARGRSSVGVPMKAAWSGSSHNAHCDSVLERVVRGELDRARPILAAGDLAEVRAVYAVVWVIVADEVKDVISIYAKTDCLALCDVKVLEERAVDLLETWCPLRTDVGRAEGVGQFRAVGTDAIVGGLTRGCGWVGAEPMRNAAVDNL